MEHSWCSVSLAVGASEGEADSGRWGLDEYFCGYLLYAEGNREWERRWDESVSPIVFLH